MNRDSIYLPRDVIGLLQTLHVSHHAHENGQKLGLACLHGGIHFSLNLLGALGKGFPLFIDFCHLFRSRVCSGLVLHRAERGGHFLHQRQHLISGFLRFLGNFSGRRNGRGRSFSGGCRSRGILGGSHTCKCQGTCRTNCYNALHNVSVVQARHARVNESLCNGSP